MVGAFGLGLARRQWWTLLIGPAVCLGGGAMLDTVVLPHDEIRGLGLFIGGCLTVVAALLWLFGRGLRRFVDRDFRPR